MSLQGHQDAREFGNYTEYWQCYAQTKVVSGGFRGGLRDDKRAFYFFDIAGSRQQFAAPQFISIAAIKVGQQAVNLLCVKQYRAFNFLDGYRATRLKPLMQQKIFEGDPAQASFCCLLPDV